MALFEGILNKVVLFGALSAVITDKLKAEAYCFGLLHADSGVSVVTLVSSFVPPPTNGRKKLLCVLLIH